MVKIEIDEEMRNKIDEAKAIMNEVIPNHPDDKKKVYHDLEKILNNLLELKRKQIGKQINVSENEELERVINQIFKFKQSLYHEYNVDRL